MMKLSIRQDVRGGVYVEFLIVFFPMMTLWLGLAQIGLMYGAHVLVHSAAARAARAAIVIIADDREGHEQRYGNVPPYQIGTGGAGLEAYKNAPSGGRLHTIRRAARITLATISPSLGSSPPGNMVSFMVGYLWTELAVAVTFPDGDGGYLASFDNNVGRITTKVTFLYRCSVPIASRLMCSPYFGSDSVIPEETLETLENAGIDTPFESGIDGQAQEELETVGGDTLGLFSMGLDIADSLFDTDAGGWRFIPLSAEKTLPLQGRYQ